MEESITSGTPENFRTEVSRVFNCKHVDLKTYSPLTLAYIGDGVYDLIIRTVEIT